MTFASNTTLVLRFSSGDCQLEVLTDRGAAAATILEARGDGS